MPKVCSVDKLGDVCSVCEVKGWEQIRVQIDSGAVETEGRKEVALKMRETAMSKTGSGYVAANGSSIKNYGEKRMDGHTGSGVGMSMRFSAQK